MSFKLYQPEKGFSIAELNDFKKERLFFEKISYIENLSFDDWKKNSRDHGGISIEKIGSNNYEWLSNHFPGDWEYLFHFRINQKFRVFAGKIKDSEIIYILRIDPNHKMND